MRHTKAGLTVEVNKTDRNDAVRDDEFGRRLMTINGVGPWGL
jgi:hypothetical protein